MIIYIIHGYVLLYYKKQHSVIINKVTCKNEAIYKLKNYLVVNCNGYVWQLYCNAFYSAAKQLGYYGVCYCN